jgi:DNA polymerase-1
MIVMPRHLRAALLRGNYMKCCASMERRGVPLDVGLLRFLQNNWDGVRRRLAGAVLSKYDLFEDLSFSHEKFETFLLDHGYASSWPRTVKSSARRLDKETMKEMVTANPELEDLRALLDTVKMPRLNIACDLDGRNRVLLGAFGSITSRNTPGSDERGTFIFAPSKWTRFLIKPPPGWAVAYLDWSNQEFGIGAVLSGDKNMIAAYNAGDPYLALAILCGAAPTGATKGSHREVRNLYKAATLAIGYGQTPWGFEKKTKVASAVAKRVFENYRRVYATYLAWREKQTDEFGIRGTLETKLCWPLYDGPRVKPNTIINFAGQANAAEMLRLAIIACRARGVQVIAPLHDAILIQAPSDQIDVAVTQARECMAQASRLILDGFELRTDCEPSDITRYPDRFYNADGETMWKRICSIVDINADRKEAV